MAAPMRTSSYSRGGSWRSLSPIVKLSRLDISLHLCLPHEEERMEEDEDGDADLVDQPEMPSPIPGGPEEPEVLIVPSQQIQTTAGLQWCD